MSGLSIIIKAAGMCLCVRGNIIIIKAAGMCLCIRGGACVCVSGVGHVSVC